LVHNHSAKSIQAHADEASPGTTSPHGIAHPATRPSTALDHLMECQGLMGADHQIGDVREFPCTITRHRGSVRGLASLALHIGGVKIFFEQGQCVSRIASTPGAIDCAPVGLHPRRRAELQWFSNARFVSTEKPVTESSNCSWRRPSPLCAFDRSPSRS